MTGPRQVLVEERAAKAARDMQRLDVGVRHAQRDSRPDDQDCCSAINQFKDQRFRSVLRHDVAYLFQRLPIVGRVADVVDGAAVGEGDSHNKLLTLHGLRTRYVAGAVLTPFRWLQRKGWLRQAVAPRGLSDANTRGGAA